MIGQFITIEGIEGAGKTSCIGCVERLLTRNNIEYITTREPGGTNLAEKIRHILLETKDEPPVELCELLSDHMSMYYGDMVLADLIIICFRCMMYR